ncbi:MAG: hypothetical protein KKA73_12495 [Chloroflexi bacterium]|nr:hypothetical protein [Chloroflexota bacterium]MBU1748502.1 hypothetical protein [Chloroflexota bacterium]
MRNRLLLGLWRFMVPLPRPIWQGEVSRGAQGSEARLGFMSPEHHLVRDFTVRELPRVGEPLSPQRIAQGVGLPVDRVVSILDELEQNMTFLFRSEQGAVTWAYPVTVEQTPHRVTFSTGEQVYAA